MKKTIVVLAIVITSLHLINFWHINLERLKRPFDPDYFSGLYSTSQYVLGEKSKGGIGDDGLYAFAGYYYFFQQGDVSAVNFEHPPLGKYLIGLSIFLFNNEIIIGIIYFIFLLITVYKLSGLLISDKYLSLLPPILISWDPLFLDHTIRSQLDLPFSLFFVTAVYFFLLIFKNNTGIYLSQLFWALAFSVRFFPFLIILEIYMAIIIFFVGRRFLLRFLLSSLLTPVIYLVTHTVFFIYHPSLVEFLRHKKWMLAWFTGTPVKFGNILRNIFTGRLLDTLDNSVVNNLWTPMQPVILVLALLCPCQFHRRNNSISVKFSPYFVLLGFVILYFLYTVILTGGQAKFIMPVFPLMAVLAVKNAADLYSIILPWIRARLRHSKTK